MPLASTPPTSVRKSGSSRLFGDVTLTGGSNITLTQSGKDISIVAALSSKIITFTRDMTAATGNVAYTGVGFQPTSLIVLADVSTAQGSIGFSDSSKAVYCWEKDADGNIYTVANALVYLTNTTVGNRQQIDSIVSYDSDGFTVNWAKTGSPTGTANIRVLAYK